MYKNNVNTEKAVPRANADRMEKILDQPEKQDAWFQPLLAGE